MVDPEALKKSSRQKLGEMIRKTREAQGIDAEDAGGSIGVSADAMRKYERGERVPEPWQLVRLAVLFGVSLDYLFTGQDKRPGLSQIREMGIA